MTFLLPEMAQEQDIVTILLPSVQMEDALHASLSLGFAPAGPHVGDQRCEQECGPAVVTGGLDVAAEDLSQTLPERQPEKHFVLRGHDIVILRDAGNARIWAFLVTLEGDYKEPDEEWLAWIPCWPNELSKIC